MLLELSDQILGICQKAVGASPEEERVGANASQLCSWCPHQLWTALVPKHHFGQRHLGHTNSISLGEGEGTRAQPIPLGLPAPEGSSGDNQHRQPRGGQSTCPSLPVWEGQEYHIIFTFLKLQACRVSPSSLFRFWRLSNSGTQKSLGYRGLTQGLMQKISSHQGSFHRLSIWVHSNLPHFFCLQFSTKYIDIDLGYGGKEGKKEETSMWMA